MSEATPRRRRVRPRSIAILVGGFALFTWLSGGPPAAEPQLPAASAAPTPRSSAEAVEALATLDAIIRAAGLAPVANGADVRPPLPPAYLDLPRFVVRGVSPADAAGMPLVALAFADTTAATTAAPEIAAYLVAPTSLVLVPPGTRFTVRRIGSLIVLFQRTPSGDPDPAAADLLEATLGAFGEAVPLPR